MTEREILQLRTEQRHDSMRGYFGFALHEEMRKNEDIWVVSIDLGYGLFDRIKSDFPTRFLNTGAAEQSALGIAVGLSLEGKKPFVYTISSFYMRALETVNLYLVGEQTPVVLIGGGRDGDYAHDGPSHNATMVQNVFKEIGLVSHYPETKEDAAILVPQLAQTSEPVFVSLRR